MVVSYHSVLVHCVELRSFLFRIAVAEYCVSALLLIFMSALIGGPVGYFPLFLGAAAFAESGILLQLPVGVHGFVADDGLFFVLTGSHLDLKKVFLA